MSWGEPKGKSLHIMLIPVVFMTFFLFSGTNFTNDSIECVDYDGQCFAPVDELINQSTDTNESEFIDVDEYFNSTEESNQTMLEPELPPKQTNQTNNTEQDEFIDVDNLFNSTEESNKTTEEFVEVEEFLNSTNQSELPEISEVEAPLNLTLVNESLSRANKTEAPTRSAVIPFSLVSANGATANASVSFIQNGKEVAPLLAEGKMRAASAQIANTRFGVPPGKYTLEVVPSKTPSASKDGLLPVPVNKVLLKEVEITESTMPSLKLEGLAASATPFGKETKQAYAIDPTSFNFTEGEVSVTAKGSELYKCAEWAYDEQKCNGKWIKIMELIPGEEYIVLINATDPAYAEYNSTLGAPRCANYTSPCIANSTLLRSRDSLTTPEPNQPNTVDGCTDGGSGTYQNDESVENITIESLTAPYDVFNEGDTVRVNATVYCWSTGASDNINFVYSSDATSPSWSVVGYVDPCPGNGFQQVSATFSLDNVLGEHVIRVINQYNGNTATTCGGGNYDDNDDLVFPVNGTAPAVNLVYPTANWIVCKGVEAFIFNTSQAGSCQLYIDGELDQATTINAAADTNYQFNASVLTSGLHNWSVRCSGVDSETRNFFLCPKYIIYQDTFQSSGGFSPDATNTAPWQRGDATQVGGCHRSDSCWATGLASNYFATGPYDDMLTQQVALNLSNYENVSMAFYHYRYFEDATTIYDAGVVEINNGTGRQWLWEFTWKPAGLW